jgi:D-tyrosyl-tRNA(Tyr) deacylase
MRAVIQRGSEAAVRIDGETTARIGPGLLILLGIENGDTEADIPWRAGKIARMRIFPDDEALMNRSLIDTGGDALLVSQFTLHASTRKGNRPSFIRAARPEISAPLCDQFGDALETELGKSVARGRFGADMKVSLLNDGPVTIVIDTKSKE